MGQVLEEGLDLYTGVMLWVTPGVGSLKTLKVAGPVLQTAAKGASVVARELTKQETRSIQSLEIQISKHEKKLVEFQNNPTVRPGMENLPAGAIQRQQQTRIDHLLTEIQTFKNNIQKILWGN